MRRSQALVALLPLVADQTLVAGQTLTIGDTVIAANPSTLAPAAQIIATSTSGSTDLFVSETIQLTDAVIANLTALRLSDVSLFDFPSSNSTLTQGKRSNHDTATCKTYPGDARWPSTQQWEEFDLLLGQGSLIKTVPYGSPCYDDYGNYDGAKCDWLTANWMNDSYAATDDPTSMYAELYQNSTCVPPKVFASGGDNCTLGGYPEYVVNVSTTAQVQLAINFARNLDLRLIVKNTGHDFNGRSIGYGSLSIWTHNLKEYTFYDSYTSGDYTGTAAKAGAGIQAFELYAACHEQNVTCIGGEGATVGLMGGYLQGGGHSPMSTLYGMAADQALAFEVVTPDGRFITADAETNPDLFWALRGGGGGTFGVVTSVTVKTYPQLPVFTIMSFSVLNVTTTSEAFWGGIQAYWNNFPAFTDAGCYSYFYIMPNVIAEGVTLWKLTPFWAPNMTQPELEALLAPMFATFAELGLNVTPTYQSFDNYYDAWAAGFSLELWGVNTGRQGQRLFPAANWANDTIRNDTFAALRTVAEDDGGWVFGFSIAPGNALALGDGARVGADDVAVVPAWRDTQAHVISNGQWNASLWASESGKAEIAAISDRVTNVWGKTWRELTPGSGGYHAEGDYMEPDWQECFWGSHYPKLLEIKQKVDPWELFYVHNGVGSEGWAMDKFIVADLPSQAGKLCRV